MSLLNRLAKLELALERRMPRMENDDDAVFIEAMRQSVGGEMPSGLLPKRWTQLRHHPVQHRLWNDDFRFKAVPAGRRSGKTELAKRHVIRTACSRPMGSNEWYVVGAPTVDQVARIYWQDLKLLTPKRFVKRIMESGRKIQLHNGCEIQAMGFDVPERIEGRPLHGIVLDEYANMLARVWPFHVRPALADTNGWAWCIGVPEGWNHYAEMCESARIQGPGWTDWGFYTWWSEDILPASEIESLAAVLDAVTFDQELRASFTAIKGRIYYSFRRDTHTEKLEYNPNRPLIFCFDFNVEPGTASIIQEQTYRGTDKNVSEQFTAVIGEVWIPRDSNTPTICRKLIEDWSHHPGDVYIYGDPAGGARSTKSEVGTDWDIIRNHLRPVFGERYKYRVKTSAPLERVRVNAMNTRLQTKDGKKHMLIDPVKCPKTVQDFEMVKVKEGTNGEIDYKNHAITHLTSGIGYYIEAKFPVRVSDPNASVSEPLLV